MLNKKMSLESGTSTHFIHSSPAPTNVSMLSTAPNWFHFGSHETRLYIGMALALGGNLLISISLSVQKKVHNRLGQESQTKYCLDKWWWLGMVLMGMGEVGNFMAYGFAPASLVAPLGSVAVIANTIIAAIFLDEPLTMPSMMGVSLVVIGAFMLISFSPASKPSLRSSEIISYLKAWPFLLYISLEVLLLAFLLYMKYKKKNEHLIILLLLVSVIASVTIIAAKALSTLITESILQGKLHFMNPVFWVSLLILPITTVAQIRFLNRAMQLYDVSDVVPVNFIFFTLSAILAGAMFYQEFYGVEFDRIFMFLFGCLQSFLGVAIITQQKEYKSSKESSSSISQNDVEPCCSNGMDSKSSFESDSEELNGYSALSSSKSCPVLQTFGGVSEFGSTGSPQRQKRTIASKEFFKSFIRSVKSSENLSEVQPLMSQLQRTSRQ